MDKLEVTPLLSIIRSDAIEKHDVKIIIEKHKMNTEMLPREAEVKARDHKTKAVFTRYKHVWLPKDMSNNMKFISGLSFLLPRELLLYLEH